MQGATTKIGKPMVKLVFKFRITPEFAYKQSFGRRKPRSIIAHQKTWRERPSHEAVMMSITYITLFCHNSEVLYPSHLRVSVT